MKFELNDAEYKLYVDFVTECRMEVPSIPTAIGGRFSITFTPTGIGNIIQVRDNQTGKTKDITDVDSW